jgi:hypothetical protein
MIYPTCMQCGNAIDQDTVTLSAPVPGTAGALNISCSHCAAGHATGRLDVTTAAGSDYYTIESTTDGPRGPVLMVVIGSDSHTVPATAAGLGTILQYLTEKETASQLAQYADECEVEIDADELQADTGSISAPGTDIFGRPGTFTAKWAHHPDEGETLQCAFTDGTFTVDIDAEEAAFLDSLDGHQRDIAAAVIEQMGDFETFAQSAADVAAHGALSGWSGFIYYSDTVIFAQQHRATIKGYGSEYAEALQEAGFYSLVAGFSCLDMTADEVADAYHDSEDSNHTEVMNALSWFALEEAARMYCDWTASR